MYLYQQSGAKTKLLADGTEERQWWKAEQWLG